MSMETEKPQDAAKVGLMTIWQVWDGDYQGDWVVATYATEELAQQHVLASPFPLRIESVSVLTELIPHASLMARLI